MENFRKTGTFSISQESLLKVKDLFSAYMITDEETVNTIKDVNKKYNYTLDPHSAVGFGAATKALNDNIVKKGTPLISLACAHPAKFPDIIHKSINIHPKLPLNLESLLSAKEHYKVLDANINQIKNYVKSTMRKQ